MKGKNLVEEQLKELGYLNEDANEVKDEEVDEDSDLEVDGEGDDEIEEDEEDVEEGKKLVARRKVAAGARERYKKNRKRYIKNKSKIKAASKRRGRSKKSVIKHYRQKVARLRKGKTAFTTKRSYIRKRAGAKKESLAFLVIKDRLFESDHSEMIANLREFKETIDSLISRTESLVKKDDFTRQEVKDIQGMIDVLKEFRAATVSTIKEARQDESYFDDEEEIEMIASVMENVMDLALEILDGDSLAEDQEFDDDDDDDIEECSGKKKSPKSEEDDMEDDEEDDEE